MQKVGYDNLKHDDKLSLGLTFLKVTLSTCLNPISMDIIIIILRRFKRLYHVMQDGSAADLNGK
jgi:hypothetical protein